MPRPQHLPTPLSSTDLVAQEQVQFTNVDGVLILPPAALQPATIKSTSKSKPQSVSDLQLSPPLSPRDRRTSVTNQRKRTLSGANKMKPAIPPSPPSPVKPDDADLPPPPSRTRKIIQMKPKQTGKTPVETLSEQPGMTTTTSAAATNDASIKPSPASKRKPAKPSATSVAGRKIARKTAHSIIERRRRCKMNEEFGVLKDMIPACTGIEMHKLAILQAGIEYVRYLEGCVGKLKAQARLPAPQDIQPRQDDLQLQDHDEHDKDDDDEEEEDENDDEMELGSKYIPGHAYRTTSPTSRSTFTNPSPSLNSNKFRSRPQHDSFYHQTSRQTSQAAESASTSPSFRPTQFHSSTLQKSQTQSQPITGDYQSSRLPPISPLPWTLPTSLQTGISPALGASHLGYDASGSNAWTHPNTATPSDKASPYILPLPHTTPSLQSISLGMPQDNHVVMSRSSSVASDSHAEATATAALLMMTQDCRGSIGIRRNGQGKGMSVRDLLST